MDFIALIWSLIKEISPFLLFGFFICGILSLILTVDTIKKYLGKDSLKSVFIASLFGVPLPLCSCGVIPVSAYLRKHGASKASTSSFLISTPQTGVDSIFITYGLLGPILAIYRPIVALMSGFIGGSLTHFLDQEKDMTYDIDCEDECCDDTVHTSKLKRVLNYGFVRLPLDIVNPLILGLFLSSIISTFIPSNYFEMYGSGIIGMLIMLFLGLPTYVCATASVPIAFVLYTKGFSLGAVLVFLMSGPATNITTITVCWKILGRKSTLIYLFTIIGSSISAGLILDSIYPKLLLKPSEYQANHLITSDMQLIFGIILTFILINALRLKWFNSVGKVATEGYKQIDVKGMTCSHCEDSIKKTLLKIDGVKNISADAKLGIVNYSSSNDNENEIRKAIIELGFNIKND